MAAPVTKPTSDPAQSAQPQPEQSPAPPEPKKIWWTYKNGQLNITEDPDRYAQAEGLFRQLAHSQQASLDNLRSFSILESPTGKRSLTLVGRNGELHPIDDLPPMPAVDYLMGKTDAPPPDQPAPADQHAPPSDQQSQPPVSPQQTGSPPATPQQSGPQQPQSPAVPLPPPPPQTSDQLTALLQQQQQQNQLLQQQLMAALARPQPMYYPMPMHGAPGAPGLGAAPLPLVGQDELQARTLLRQHLAAQLPLLQQILDQIPNADGTRADHLNLALQITHIQDQTRVYQDLVMSQHEIEVVVHRYLQREILTKPNLATQFATIRDTFQAGSESRTYLDALLNPPAPPAVAAPLLSLDTQLTVIASVKTHLQTQIAAIETALRDHFEMAALPRELQRLQAALNGIPELGFDQLIAIDRNITNAFRNQITAKITALQNSTNTWLAADRFTFQTVNNPALIADQTRAQLLREPENLRNQYDAYIRAKHAQLPEAVRDKAPLPAANAKISALEAMPNQMRDAFNNYLDEKFKLLPKQVKDAFRHMPTTTIEECQAKYNQMRLSLQGYLAVQARGVAPGAVPNITALLAELNNAASGPTLDRLLEIMKPIEEYHRPFLSRHSGKIMTIVGLAALAFIAYAVITRISTGSFDSFQQLPTTLASKGSEVLTGAKDMVCNLAKRVQATGVPFFRKVVPGSANMALGCQIEVPVD